MKFTRFFGLSLALLALVLLFSACNSNNKDDNNDDDDNKNPPNGSVFRYIDTDKNQHVFISIYSNTSRQITPNAGYNYAVVVIAIDPDGSVTYQGGSDSTGKLSAASDGKFSFESDDSEETGVGYINGTDLIMEKIPDTDYGKTTLKHLYDGNFSADKPFDDNINTPKTGSNNNDNNNNNNTGIRGSEFKPGNYVTKIQIDPDNPVKLPSTVYWGTKVEISNGAVIVTYSDYSTRKVTIDATSFYIDPPYYTVPGTSHTLYYIGEYNNLSSLTFLAPKTDLTISDKTIFYEKGSAQTSNITTTGKESIKWYEGYGFDLSNVHSKVKFKEYKNGTVGTSFTTTMELYTDAKLNSLNEVTLYVGDTQDGIVSTFKPATDKLNLSGITIVNAPFSQQITFDDPRFFEGGTIATAESRKYWYSHLSDVTIGLSYTNSSLNQEIRFAKAAMGLGLLGGEKKSISFTTPDKWFKTNEKGEYVVDNEIKITYGNYTTNYAIPLYDKLAEVSIIPNSNSPIVLDGKNAHDVNTFLKLVKVYAIYQSGNNKNNTIQKPIYIGNNFNEFYKLCINGDVTTNVKTTGPDGILTPGNSISYDKNKKLQKATITLTTYDGSDNNKNSATTASPKKQTETYSISVGVTGY